MGVVVMPRLTGPVSGSSHSENPAGRQPELAASWATVQPRSLASPQRSKPAGRRPNCAATWATVQPRSLASPQRSKRSGSQPWAAAWCATDHPSLSVRSQRLNPSGRAPTLAAANWLVSSGNGRPSARRAAVHWPPVGTPLGWRGCGCVPWCSWVVQVRTAGRVAHAGGWYFSGSPSQMGGRRRQRGRY